MDYDFKSLPIGNRLLLRTALEQRPMRASFIGITPSGRLLVSVPLTTGVRTRFLPGNMVEVRAVADEHVVSFSARVAGFSADPEGIVHLLQPEQVLRSRITRRGNERAPCTFPAVVGLGETEFNGVVRDLSACGCRLLLKSREIEGSDVGPGAVLQVRFYGLERSLVYDLPAEVRHVSRENGNTALGLSFTEEAGRHIPGLIAEFVADIRECLE